ncbi:unnamed protein product, partial [Amoebophrya sp. A120]
QSYSRYFFEILRDRILVEVWEKQEIKKKMNTPAAQQPANLSSTRAAYSASSTTGALENALQRGLQESHSLMLPSDVLVMTLRACASFLDPVSYLWKFEIENLDVNPNACDGEDDQGLDQELATSPQENRTPSTENTAWTGCSSTPLSARPGGTTTSTTPPSLSLEELSRQIAKEKKEQIRLTKVKHVELLKCLATEVKKRLNAVLVFRTNLEIANEQSPGVVEQEDHERKEAQNKQQRNDPHTCRAAEPGVTALTTPELVQVVSSFARLKFYDSDLFKAIRRYTKSHLNQFTIRQAAFFARAILENDQEASFSNYGHRMLAIRCFLEEEMEINKPRNRFLEMILEAVFLHQDIKMNHAAQGAKAT